MWFLGVNIIRSPPFLTKEPKATLPSLRRPNQGRPSRGEDRKIRNLTSCLCILICIRILNNSDLSFALHIDLFFD